MTGPDTGGPPSGPGGGGAKPGPRDIAFPQRENAHPNGWDAPRDAKTKDVPYTGHHLKGRKR